jgi:hypothetical protein
MRALGPGSVSSFLKMVLDVAYGLVGVGVGLLVLLAVAALLFSVNPALLGDAPLAEAVQLESRAPLVIGGLLAAAAYLGGVLVVIRALRGIFTALIAGDPFHPENVGRLRLIALMLAFLELGRYAVWATSAWLPTVRAVRPTFSLAAWFAVLVVFVLAEVFREGARLRREAELTI